MCTTGFCNPLWGSIYTCDIIFRGNMSLRIKEEDKVTELINFDSTINHQRKKSSLQRQFKTPSIQVGWELKEVIGYISFDSHIDNALIAQNEEMS